MTSPSSGIGVGGAGVTGNEPFTLEGWYRDPDPSGTPPAQALLTVGSASQGAAAGLDTWSTDSTGLGGQFAHYASSLVVDMYNGEDEFDTSTAGVNLYDGNWHYLMAVYDPTATVANASVPGSVTGYVDGKQNGAPQAPPNPVNLGAGDILVGSWVDNQISQPFLGDADDIAVYPTALSAASATTTSKRASAHSLVAGGLACVAVLVAAAVAFADPLTHAS